MMATEQPFAHVEEQQQHYDEGETGEGEEDVSPRHNLSKAHN